jgi:type III pantothenate kinase
LLLLAANRVVVNLVIDVGNTRIKWAVFNKAQQMLEHGKLSYEETDRLAQLIATSDYAILSDVVGQISLPQSVNDVHFISLNAKTPLPIRLDYETPETLGNDRIASAVGTRLLFPDENCLVIDAGTCITVDLISDEGVFLGGSIAPGLQMRLNAMHHFTGKLPQLVKEDKHYFHGKSTKQCMLSGAIDFSLLEIDAVIQRYKEGYENLRVILTGGDAEFLAKGLKSNTFADLFLVEKGLNEILRFNS